MPWQIWGIHAELAGSTQGRPGTRSSSQGPSKLSCGIWNDGYPPVFSQLNPTLGNHFKGKMKESGGGGVTTGNTQCLCHRRAQIIWPAWVLAYSVLQRLRLPTTKVVQQEWEETVCCFNIWLWIQPTTFFYVKASLGISRCLHCCGPWRFAPGGPCSLGAPQWSSSVCSGVCWAAPAVLAALPRAPWVTADAKLSARECTLQPNIEINTS